MRNWIGAAQDAVRACDGFVETMRDGLATAGDEDQRLLHGFAWYATTAAALSATAQWALGALFFVFLKNFIYQWTFERF